MKSAFILGLAILLFNSCQKETITIGTNVSDAFYLDNQGASMRVLVEGNTGSHVFLVLVHGGPGAGSYFYNTDYISSHIENNYAVVYWDQRNSGASQGNLNGEDLHLSQMTDDLKKLIQLLKKRYGVDSEVFLSGHSFGGLLVSSFITEGNNQSMIKGLIMADGSHDYPLNDTLTRHMLLSMGQQQIFLGINKDKWDPIVDYCLSHTMNFSLEESLQLESYASEAEAYFPGVREIGLSDFTGSILEQDWPVTAILFNYLYSKSSALNEELAITRFSDSLYKVQCPVLLLYGKYDFVCPVGLGEDFYNRISSAYKKLAISPISGHALMFQDPQFFCDEVDDFIEQNK